MQIQFSGTGTLLEYLYLMLLKLETSDPLQFLKYINDCIIFSSRGFEPLVVKKYFLYTNNTDSNNQKIK